MSPALRQAVFFLLLLAIPTAGYFVVFRPLNEKIKVAKQEIAHKESMLAELRKATAQTEDLAKANQEMQAAIEAIQARLPSTKEMDNVLRQVANLAAKAGLKIPQFRKNEQILPAGLASEQPLDIEITGDFDGFYRFLLDLEQLPRITRIPDFNIVRSDKVDGEMKTKLTLSVYYQGEGKEDGQ
jgi:type IV pilus assembly protein PilO